MTSKLVEQRKRKKVPALTKQQKIAIWLIGVCVIFLWLLNLYVLRNFSPQARGTVGDLFGAVNALFSGLAFAGIIFTILLQRNELELQRNELEETRNEFILQHKTLRLQRFENTLFSMI